MRGWLMLLVCVMLLPIWLLPFHTADAKAASAASTEDPNAGVTMAASGGGHTLALKKEGTVWAWGNNAYGQLGYGSSSEGSKMPVQVQGLDSVIAISAGSEHSLALKSDGTVWAWGSNASGQLGDGSTMFKSSSPVQVANLSSAVAIAAGIDHNLAVLSDGTVWAWGANAFGSLGDGSRIDRNAPVQVQGLGSVTDVAAGNRHSMALTSDGTVWAWGNNGGGELGDGTATDRYTPVQVKDLGSVIDIAAGSSNGFSHSMALKSDGTVWAWGNNYAGKLGDGTTTGSSTPIQVTHLDSVTAIAAGGDHSMALKSDGTVWAWGENHFGQLGNGSSTNRSSPVQVTRLDSVSAIAAGASSLAVRTDGTVWGWGLNGNGQLGDGTTTAQYTPVQVQGAWLAVPMAPQWPQGDALTVTDVTSTGVRLNWKPAIDQTGVDKYLVYRTAFELLATLNGDANSYEVKGLSPESTYTLSVVAVDADGNQSEKKELTFTTAPVAAPGIFRLSDSKTYSDGWTTYEYALYYGYVSSPGQVLSGSWTPPEGYHGLITVSMISPDGENVDLSLQTVDKEYRSPRPTSQLPDGTEYSRAGVPVGSTAVWQVKGHTEHDYSPDQKVFLYVSIAYDNH
ncbi:RCC1 domain-containing protein [Paenibacillus glycinis]|uniref:Fibronectin type-III domain-containing protein n=1 Tax=Paenibacillus glycinis TaxID=2697035 RepID=A0ABW9XKK0_9BACL|nr:fibronectin type III domain-containing protein [Paenibacillus glycinis]NBD22977.1 hypothetical protein [Paenibacillus glycinis]